MISQIVISYRCQFVTGSSFLNRRSDFTGKGDRLDFDGKTNMEKDFLKRCDIREFTGFDFRNMLLAHARFLGQLILVQLRSQIVATSPTQEPFSRALCDGPSINRHGLTGSCDLSILLENKRFRPDDKGPGGPPERVVGAVAF